MKSERRQGLPLRRRLLILLAVMVLPFLVYVIYQAWRTGDSLEESTKRENIATARTIARSLDDYVASTGDLLVSLSENTLVKEADYAQMQQWFSAMLTRYPHYANIIFVDNDGYIRAAGRRQPKGPGAEGEAVRVADTVYYRRAMANEGVSVGDFMYGRISGAPVVHVTYPARNAHGERIGFVAAALMLERIQDRVMLTGVAEDTVVAVVSSDGIVLARSAEPQKYIGKDMSGQMGIAEMLAMTEGSQIARQPDGLERVVGFTRAEKVPWYVRVGTARDELQDRVREQVERELLVFLPLLGIALVGFLWIGREVDRLHAETTHLSLVDPMTDVWNFRKLSADMDSAIEHAKRHVERLTLAMIDIDDFKAFNDRFGHQTGDEVLYRIAQTIRSTVRSADSVYRYGGEEFCVLMPATDARDGDEVAERIRRAVAAAAVRSTGGEPLSVTVSVGLATYPRDATRSDDLMRCADQALLAAKAAGKDRVRHFETPPASVPKKATAESGGEG